MFLFGWTRNEEKVFLFLLPKKKIAAIENNAFPETCWNNSDVLLSDNAFGKCVGPFTNLFWIFFEYFLYLKVSLHLWGKVCVLWSSFSVIREWMAVSNCAFLSNCRLDSISVCCLQTRKKKGGGERPNCLDRNPPNVDVKQKIESYTNSLVPCRILLLLRLVSCPETIHRRSLFFLSSSSSLSPFHFRFRRWQKWEQ